MINLFSTLNGIFSKATESIIKGIYQAGATIFNNEFFTAIFALFVVYVGIMIAFRKIQSEELAYKLTWTVFIFSFVKAFMYDPYYYDLLVSFLDLPRLVFTELIVRLVNTTNSEASVESLINVLYTASNSLTDSLFKVGSLTNFIPLIYGVIVWFTSTFLILVILLTTVFSVFLSQVVLALGVFIVPFLLIKKTEYIFYSWSKLYISISLYAPFTILFGLIAVETANTTIHITKLLETDFKANIEFILVLVLAQALTIIAIFKIPNIINQIIGSSNEGTSLTSGVGTVSAGATVMSGFSKMTGFNFVSRVAQSGASKVNSSIGKKSAEKWNDIKAGGRD